MGLHSCCGWDGSSRCMPNRLDRRVRRSARRAPAAAPAATAAAAAPAGTAYGAAPAGGQREWHYSPDPKKRGDMCVKDVDVLRGYGFMEPCKK